MINRVGNPLANLLSTETRWANPEESIGEFIKIIDGKKSCWKAKGRARMVFELLAKDIKTYSDNCIDFISGSNWVTWSIYMIGRTPQTATPVIMFFCEERGPRRMIQESVQKSGILKRYPGIKSGNAPLPPDLEQLEPLASDGESHGDNYNVSLTRNKVVVEFHHGNAISTRIATAGGILRFNGDAYVFTAGHLFYETSTSDPPRESKGRDDKWEIDSDSDSDDDAEIDTYDNEFVESTSQASNSCSDNGSSDASSTQSSLFSNPFWDSLTPSNHPLSSQAASCQDATIPTSGVITSPIDADRVGVKPSVFPSSTIRGGHLVVLSADLDYALLKFKDSSVLAEKDSHVDNCTAHPDQPTHVIQTVSRETKIITSTVSGGLMTGTLNGTPSYTRLPNSTTFQKVYTVQLDGPLVKGDCGSWVIDAECRGLYGHIIAGSEGTGTAYIMSAYKVFEDAHERLGRQLAFDRGFASNPKSSINYPETEGEMRTYDNPISNKKTYDMSHSLEKFVGRRRNLSLARDPSDNDSQPTARNTEPREESPRDAHHESIEEGNRDEQTTSVPDNILHEERSGDSTSDTVLTPTIPISLDEAMSNSDERPRSETFDFFDHVEDYPIQQTLSYSLQLAFESESLPGDGISRAISANNQSFREIEREAEKQVRSRCAKSLGARELIFRYGSCTIFDGEGYESVHSLTYLDDWRDLRTILFNHWTSGTQRRLSLKISRDYYALATTATGEESFAKTKNSEIHTLMKKADGKYYIPRTDLRNVTSKETIRQIIMEDASINNMALEEKEAFVRDVQTTARKLLALCVYTRVDMRCLKKLRDLSVSDESLPLGDSNRCHDKCGAIFQDLLAKQGSFMAPVFNILGEHQILRSCFVLPIHFVPKVDQDGTVGSPKNVARGLLPLSEVEEQVVLRRRELASCGSGAYSRVYRVRIDPDHHKLSPNRDCLFALKEFTDRPQKGDHKFEQERKILDELSKLSFEHVVVHCATWIHDQRYYMLFPYAECNLREYMEQQVFGACTKRNVLWFLRQLRNLADALRNIHNITEAPQLPSSPNLASPNPELRKSAWHHDIKPENILCFQGTGSKKGMWKIADFGISKLHTLRSGRANKMSPKGTITYDPPEAHAGGGATSRPYDIWSFGCVSLELLLWAVLGLPSVQRFAAERRGRSLPDSINNITDDAFWQMKARVPVLRPAVVETLQLLKESVLKQGSQPFKEVVELIPKMLEPNPQHRIVALDLFNTLDQIYKQKKVDLAIINDESLLIMVSDYPGNALSPRSGRHRPYGSLNDASPSSDLAPSPQSASASSVINNPGSRRSSNASNSNAISLMESEKGSNQEDSSWGV